MRRPCPLHLHMDSSPALSSLYVGYDDGDFSLLGRIGHGSASEGARAPSGARYVESIERTPPLSRGVLMYFDDELRLLRQDDRPGYVAAWLHDCGKVTTPEYVVDKATKLESIHDRIHEVRMRFEVLKRDAEIDCPRAVAGGEEAAAAEIRLLAVWQQLDDDFAFVARCNEGGESMAEHDALTAIDRPYKTGKTLSPELAIMSRMQRDQHIDGELFALFLRAGVHLEYARRFMQPEQIESVDIDLLLAHLEAPSDAA
jgi:hypothetical protein